MASDWKKGVSRICIVLAVVWVAGMSWYQYKDAKQVEDSSVTLSMSDKQFRIDTSGVRQEDPQSVQAERLAVIILPALLLLLVAPIGGWLARGFKSSGA